MLDKIFKPSPKLVQYIADWDLVRHDFEMLQRQISGQLVTESFAKNLDTYVKIIYHSKSGKAKKLDKHFYGNPTNPNKTVEAMKGRKYLQTISNS